MDSPKVEEPPWRTGPLWTVLAVLLVLGSVGSATLVYGVLAWSAGSPLGIAEATFGGVVAFLALLFMVGILYRIDRYRGAVARTVKLFE